MTDKTHDFSNQIDIDNLDELILDLHTVVYDKSPNYETGFINMSDLSNKNLKRFKLTDYDLDIIFSKTPIKFFENRQTGLVYNGEEVEQILVKRQGDLQMSLVRIVPYIDEDALSDPTDPVNVNQIIRTILSELVVNERTGNILLPIINVDIKGSDLSNYSQVNDRVDPEKYYSAQITEKFYSMINLGEFLRNYPLDVRTFKTIIYQAVDLLYQIGISYPNFRHNQFLPEHIECYLRPEKENMYPELKLADFYLSEIKELVTNNYLSSGQVDIPQIDSNYSDLYQLLNYLWNNLQVEILKHPEIVEIFDVLLPKKIRSSDIYLSNELYDKLNDDEKKILNIKNIRNNTFFTSRDSPVGPSPLSGEDIPIDKQVETETESIIETETEPRLSRLSNYPRRNTFKIRHNTRYMDKKYSNDIGNMRNNTASKKDLDKDIFTARTKNSRNKSRKQDIESVNSDVYDDYNDYDDYDNYNHDDHDDYDDLSDHENSHDQSEFDSMENEYRGQRRINNEPSRIEKSRGKQRNYRGVRQIKNDYCPKLRANGSNYNHSRSSHHDNDRFDDDFLFDDNMDYYQGQNYPANTQARVNPYGSNNGGNLIANALGANDFSAVQIGNQYGDQSQAFMGAPQMNQNVQNFQYQQPMMNQPMHGQPVHGQPVDMEAYNRFMSTMNGMQVQGQQQMPMMNNVQMQMDPSLTYNSPSQMSQTGGNTNPFFFQPHARHVLR